MLIAGSSWDKGNLGTTLVLTSSPSSTRDRLRSAVGEACGSIVQYCTLQKHMGTMVQYCTLQDLMGPIVQYCMLQKHVGPMVQYCMLQEQKQDTNSTLRTCGSNGIFFNLTLTLKEKCKILYIFGHCSSIVTHHNRFISWLLFRLILPSIAAESMFSSSHELRHDGLVSYMAGECNQPSRRERQKTNFADLGV